MKAALPYLLVGLGGFFGANARFVLARWIGTLLDTRFPMGTLVVNLIGCFALGGVAAIVLTRVVTRPDDVRLAVAVGFLGAFTTFSTFGYETLALIEDGSWLAALINILVSVALGLLAVHAGALAVRNWLA